MSCFYNFQYIPPHIISNLEVFLKTDPVTPKKRLFSVQLPNYIIDQVPIE